MNSAGIALGDRAKDKITGFKGVVIAVTQWLYNCDRLCIQPEDLKDGKPVDEASFDADQCALVKKGVIKPQAQEIKEPEVQNGDTARDNITGYEGVCIGITHWLHNPDSLILQPQKLDKDETTMTKAFSRQSLTLVKRKVIKVEREEGTKPGGPMDTPRLPIP